jgi:hypothetical protein
MRSGQRTQRLLRQALKSPHEVFFYWRISPVSRSQTADLIGYLGLDLHGRHVTDLGPAIGSSLAVFRAAGASCYFVERHPAHYAVCRTRGFRGALGDFVARPDLVPRELDIVYARGSTTAASFPDADALRTWVRDLSARSELLLLCPYWGDPDPGWFKKTLDEELEPH